MRALKLIHDHLFLYIEYVITRFIGNFLVESPRNCLNCGNWVMKNNSLCVPKRFDNYLHTVHTEIQKRRKKVVQ